MLKKLRVGTEQEFLSVIEIAKDAMELSKRIYGDETFITNSTVLTYAMALTKVESRLPESVEPFAKAEAMF